MRVQVGLLEGGEVEVEVDVLGAAILIEAVSGEDLQREGPFLIIPATGLSSATTRYTSSGLLTSAEKEQGSETHSALVDTSVAVAIALAGHEAHPETIRAVHGLALGLAGHA